MLTPNQLPLSQHTSLQLQQEKYQENLTNLQQLEEEVRNQQEFLGKRKKTIDSLIIKLSTKKNEDGSDIID